MLMPDVNILVYAHRAERPEHLRYAKWLTELVAGPEPFALSEPVLQSFVRVVTNPRIYTPASTVQEAFGFLEQLLALPRCLLIRPGPEHWAILQTLCKLPGVRGYLVADAAHAALAIESGCEWVTADTDFARFAPLLRWVHL
ncbi:MAG: type II toxin-antitoxin system VapC family toxin [Acidobacteriota bacterium]